MTVQPSGSRYLQVRQALTEHPRVWLVTGAGAITALIWEVGEYTSFVQKVEQLGIYRDTVGDLCLGTSGALLAGLIVSVANRSRHRLSAKAQLLGT